MRKKVEPKQLPRGAVLEIGASLQGGADFFLNNHVPQVELSYGRTNGSTCGAVLAPLFFSVQVCPSL